MTDAQELLKLELLDYNENMEKCSKQLQQRITEIKARNNRSGVLLSGVTLTQIAEARRDSCESLIEARLAARRKYAAMNPELVTADHLEPLKRQCLAIVESLGTVLTTPSPDLPQLPKGDSRFAEDYTFPLQAKIERGIARLEIEGKIGMIDSTKGSTVLNISNSVITGLNVGAVVGDMISTVDHLQQQGNVDFAAALKTLIEKFAADEQLGNDRRDILEHLALVGEEAERPAEKRRLGVVRTAVEHISSLVAVASQAKQLWAEWGPQIVKFFGLLS